MPGPRDARTSKSLTREVEEMKIEGDTADKSALCEPFSTMDEDDARPTSAAGRDAPSRRLKRSSPSSASKQSSAAQSPVVKAEQEETIGGDITVKLEPGKAPKLSRTMSQKVVPKPRQLFSHLPDSTDEAAGTFEVLPDCTYAARYLGVTEQALECDCTEEWDSQTRTNHACGEDSDCINRATKMECPDDCSCGDGCQNRRFQRKQYANVSVIKTEMKGFGLRANKDLKANDFIFEYIGEVISEPAFHRRMHQYDEEGIKHFYFMSLSKGEFVDATKKGNMGRFCNHSCNPNCFVDKWVVGERLRMGIFAERHIQAGEELTFNYNVDRYGAEPQACYCGEPNCSGYIGGKTQTGGNSVTLTSSTQIALGILNNEDWDTATQKKPRKKKASEDDEEYVDSVEVKPPGLQDIVNVMGELYKNQEKWIVVKLLSRVQRTDDERVRLKAAKLHGYNVFNKLLKAHADDNNVLLQILDILNKIPRLTRNKIADSTIDVTVGALADHEDDKVKEQANKILNEWSKLEMGYRIPRVKRDPNAVQADKRPDRSERKNRDRSRSRSRSRSKSAEAPKGPATKVPNAPSGPRGNASQRGYFQGSSRPPYRPRAELPAGWYQADVPGQKSTYYYNAAGATTWQRPTQPAMGAPPPPPPKVLSDKQQLDDLIQNIVNRKETPRTEKPSATATPTETPPKSKSEAKWTTMPEEKQKKIYENTIHPSVSHVASKYKDKLSRAEIKKHAKDCAKKVVNSDYKHKRVTDPTKIDAKQEKGIRKFVVEYFEKCVKQKAQSGGRAAPEEKASTTPIGSPNGHVDANSGDKTDTSGLPAGNGLSNISSAARDSIASPATLKRHREEAATASGADGDSTGKKARLEAAAVPPPPPPPPTEGAPEEDDGGNEDSVAEGFTIKGVARGLQRVSKYGESPMQVATPPTTGSPDEDERERRRREYSGVNAERMRHLGFTEGASNQ